MITPRNIPTVNYVLTHYPIAIVNVHTVGSETNVNVHYLMQLLGDKTGTNFPIMF